MTSPDDALERLLADALPLASVGQQLREAARRALLSGDRDRMAVVARVLVGELLRRGDLVRVAIQDDAAGSAAFCMRRDTRELVDLSPLQTGEPGSFEFPLPPTVTLPAAADDPLPDDLGIREVAGVLGAMEQAQNLAIGDPQSGSAGVILAGILELLARFTPQFRLFLLMHEPIDVPLETRSILVEDEQEHGRGWLALRERGSAVWIPEIASLPRRIREDATAAGEPLRSAAAVPLIAPDDVRLGDGEPEVGLLFVVATETWERDALLRLASRLSRFVTRRWQQQRQVNQRIHTDSLTGVFNRAYFDSQFTLELERARRSNVPLTLVMSDLDRFKSVNDRLGHHVGDRVLKTAAHRLQEELRRIDHVCRIGGEEFALVLPDTSGEAAHDVLRRLLNAAFVTEVVLDGEEQQVTTTFSYGAVTFPDAGVDAFELFRKADAMLYLSKDSGRNRCHFWSSSGDHLELLPD